MGCCLSINRRPQSESTTPSALTHSVHSSVQGNEEAPAPGNQAQDVPFPSGPAALPDENDERVITGIQATDVAHGLRRIPAGFYAVVHHSALEWRTENKRSSVNSDIIEWDEPIPIPSDLSATICLGIYASFEFQPMLGNGEQLRTLTITVEQLLNRSAEHLPFVFFPMNGDVVSPCSSVLVTVGRRKRESDPSASRVLVPHCSTTESRGQLESATDEGHSALSRYRKHGERRDLERSIEQFEFALSICPPDHPCYAVAQSNMGMTRLIQCRVDDTNFSLDIPLGLYHGALSARPVDHPDRPSTLIQLAAVHFGRFEKWRDEADIARATELLHEVMDLSSAESHENRVATSFLQLRARHEVSPVQAGSQSSVEPDSVSGLIDEELSADLLERFERFGDLDDLQQAISLLEAPIRSASVWDHRYLTRLTNLGAALLRRFQQLGKLDDLEQAISRLGDAIDFTPDGNPDKPGRLSNLGSCFLIRFECLGKLSDLEQAILRLGVAVDLTPDDHGDKPGYLNNLGSSFRTRFDRLGALSDLEQAISRLEVGIGLAPDGHPDGPSLLTNLGRCFLVRFHRLGELHDLEQAISRLGGAVDLTPDGHPAKSNRLNILGGCSLTRFERLGELSDLEDAILKLGDAVNFAPDGHPGKPGCLGGLGHSFLTRFQRLGELSDLEEAISRQRDAVDLTPDGDPDKPGRLNNLGISLLTRFRRLEELSDLEQGISKLGAAIALIPDDHPDKPVYLNNLGSSFRARFERLGELSDLEQAISRQRVVVSLTPNDHPDQPIRINNLGKSFLDRFEHLGELSDLENAISRLGDAVDLTPDGHPDKPGHFSSLGRSFLTRFQHLGEPSDLEQTISNFGDAVDLTVDSHPDKPGYLSNLGSSFLVRFRCLDQLSDLEQGMSIQRNAVDLTPDGHPDKPAHLNNLGTSFRTRFECLGGLSDLEQAISMQRDAVGLVPDRHYGKPSYLSNLGDTLRTRFEYLGEQSDLEQAISLYSHAACASIGATSTLFRASQNWISCARILGHRSLLCAYSFSIGLLPRLAWIGLSLADRYHQLMEGADVVREAAAAALDSGHPELAVEWLEQGRSIVWGELFQLRSSYDELSVVHPDHARRLRELSAKLEHASASREKSMSSRLERTETLEQEANRHRSFAIERDKLLQEIRRLPGFERFLLHKEFSQLRTSAHAGPVVILNAAESRCDALIVLADMDNVIHVPLPNFTLERSESLQSSLKSLIRREGKSILRERPSQWEPILSALWKCVVKPVLDSLAILTPEDLSRIFWCPTGPFTFLPIHAAGFYDTKYSQSGNKIFDFVVSSYVPTLSILAPSPKQDATSSGDLHFLAVRQPQSDGLLRLPGVYAELAHIKAVIQNHPSARTTLVESSLGTVEEVLDLMKGADWVHFACHGAQDGVNSGLCLADERRLKLSDIITLSRPRGGLAFLSACQTATGDKKLSDEAIHIAAGMLFAGYGGVVGTMWSISDRLAPYVARDVYEQLFRKGMRPNYREAARALQDAVGYLRDGGASFGEWLPFIHVGL